MAVQALILKYLVGKKPSPGARPATQELEVSDYEEIFRSRTIYTGQRESKAHAPSPAPLYKRILGEAWDALPAPLAALHNVTSGELNVEGVARVETGKNLFARLIGALYSFPRSGEHMPVKVSFQRKDDGELWQRDFAGRRFSTIQSEGQGYTDKLLVESFGPVTFYMALVLKQGELHSVTRHWSIFGISLPLALSPDACVYEYADGDDFCFYVEVKHWLTGLLVKYEGRLVAFK